MCASLVKNPDPEKWAEIWDSVNTYGFLNVWEGAVRSGKTVAALWSFAQYAIASPETKFLLSGRTVKTIEQNAIMGEYGLLSRIAYSVYKRSGESRAILFRAHGRDKIIIVAGASDIRAYMALRGQSFGGWFADEINMHDKEFVAEAMRRTVVSSDRRHFWTLNPDDPHHWVYTDYIDRYMGLDEDEKKALGGVYLWRWTPDYNPAMTPAMMAALRAQYMEGSVQYRRYVLGERCVAEGLVYPMFGPSCIEEPPAGLRPRYASMDFGTVHPTAMGWYGRDPVSRTWYKLRDWCASPEESARMTTADYMDVFERITKELGGIPRMNLTIDYGGGGEALAREAERRGWMPQNPDKDVLDGIAYTARMLNTGRLKISPACKPTIDSLESYRWDDKASERGETKPLKKDDDPADETRYAVTTFIEPRIRR